MAFYKSPPFRTENAPCFVAKDSRGAIVVKRSVGQAPKNFRGAGIGIHDAQNLPPRKENNHGDELQ